MMGKYKEVQSQREGKSGVPDNVELYAKVDFRWPR